MQTASLRRYAVGQIGTPGQGSFMTIVLTLDGDTVSDAKFSTYPCPAANACGNFVVTWAEGKSMYELESLSNDIVLQSIGNMPLGREHCPGLAVGAVKDAVKRLSLIDENSFVA